MWRAQPAHRDTRPNGYQFTDEYAHPYRTAERYPDCYPDARTNRHPQPYAKRDSQPDHDAVGNAHCNANADGHTDHYAAARPGLRLRQLGGRGCRCGDRRRDFRRDDRLFKR